MNETFRHEMTIATAWYEGIYTEKSAKRTAELQGLDFNSIKERYGRLYAKYEAMSR